MRLALGMLGWQAGLAMSRRQRDIKMQRAAERPPPQKFGGQKNRRDHAQFRRGELGWRAGLASWAGELGWRAHCASVEQRRTTEKARCAVGLGAMRRRFKARCAVVVP